MAIRMRVNNKQNSSCMECGRNYNYTQEMYDINVCGEIFTLCFKCSEVLFKKLLSANVQYNGRTKSKNDLRRIRNAFKADNPELETVKEKRPDCFGNFVKKQKCKQCVFLEDCKQTWESQWEE